MGSFGMRGRTAVLSIVTAASFLGAPAIMPVSAHDTSSGEAQRVVAAVRRHLGAHFRLGTTGPRYFDCSGLVYRSFQEAGLVSRIGGRRNTARGYLAYFRARHLASASGGRVGDVVIYGNGTHSGIYIGNGKVISALESGVRVHGLRAVTARFTAFLHTGLSGGGSSSAGAGTNSVPNGTSMSPTRVATTTNVHLRAGPGVGYASDQVVAKGTVLTAVAWAPDHDGANPRWYKVRTSSGRTLWVASWLTRRM